MKKVYAKFAGAALLIGGLIATAIFAPGCATTGGPAIITDTNTVNTVSNYLAITVWEATAYGMRSDSNTTVTVGIAVLSAVNEVRGGTDFTPGALAAAFGKMPIAVLQKPIASILIDSVETLYQLYWASDVQGSINGDYAAKTYLGAFAHGIEQGVSGKPSPLSPLMLKRPVPRLQRP